MTTLKEIHEYRAKRIRKLIERMPAVTRAIEEKIKLTVIIMESDAATISKDEATAFGAEMMFANFNALHGLASSLELSVLTMDFTIVRQTIDSMEAILSSIRQTGERYDK